MPIVVVMIAMMMPLVVRLIMIVFFVVIRLVWTRHSCKTSL
jgi:hypothetical protein